MWPLISSDKINLSIEETAAELKTIKIQTLQEPRGKSVEWSHINCKTLNMRTSVAKILEEIPNPVLESHRVHMKEQRGEVASKDMTDVDLGTSMEKHVACLVGILLDKN